MVRVLPGPDGLLDRVPGWLLLDWASVYSVGRSSILNALWARALEDLAEMAHGSTTRARNDGRVTGELRVAAAFDVFWTSDVASTSTTWSTGSRDRLQPCTEGPPLWRPG